jgi:hypothetical protein
MRQQASRPVMTTAVPQGGMRELDERLGSENYSNHI